MIGGPLKRTLITVHRWLGVPLSLFFALWFPSAIGTMYFDYPSVTAADRLSHAGAIEAHALRVPVDNTDSPQELRLNVFDGRPVYRIRVGGSERVMFADTGELRGAASPALMRRVAAQWAARSDTDARVDEVVAVDQWTVQAPLRTMRPLWKFSFDDGQQVYVAQATGEVMQATTTASRIGAYLGPIPHWIYFTPLRQRQQLWNSVVVWSSGAATVAATIGLILGVWMSAPNGRVPYRGQKRWHVIAGLFFGAGAVTWAFSGMLSMDPFPALETPRPTLHVRTPLALASFTRTPAEAIDALDPLRVKELEWVSILGEPAYLATIDDGSTRVVAMHGSPTRSFDVERIAAALQADGQTVSVLDHFDAYYRDRHHRRPLPVLHALPSGAYVDPATARVVDSYSDADWTSRWLYHGLHSLDFPWLYDRRPLWDAIVIAFMVGGTALSVTSLILAWRVVRRPYERRAHASSR
jgi:hypothetical protein